MSVTPSGGWIPAVIAGRTGIGLSQRAQSFVTDAADGPFNVIEPGKRPRVTLTPTLALKDGLPFLAFAVQGGDSQDQNLLQFFLNVVVFGMSIQQALDEEKGARLVFADGTESIYLADMSGDGLTDLVRIRNGEVCYWPNLGYGR